MCDIGDFLDVGTAKSLKRAPDFLGRNGFLPADSRDLR
jgi:hypothetical protein